ncbi:ABC transporter substrate-binding protein [Rhodobium orientis]
MGALAASADTIKIGTVLSATGPASFLGDPEMKTLELYVKEINAAGGVDGNELELVAYDSGVDASKARTFATRLVEEDEVVAVVGGSTTGTTMAMIPVFEDAEIPFISLAGAVVIIDPVKKWVFKTPHTDRMACEKIFEDMQKRGISKVGMISGTGGFGKSMRDQCLDVAGNYDVEIIADETYGAKDSDMTPQLTNIKNTEGLEAVVNPGFGQGPAIVTRNYKQLGIDVPLYQSHGVASKSFIELAGDAAEGVRLPAAALLVADKLPDDDPQKSVVVGYKDKYEGATGEPVSTFGGHAYDGLMMLVEAIKRAGSADPAAIRDEIEKTSGFMGTAGVVNMSADDHLGLDLTAFRMLEVKNGDWTIAE